MFPLIIKLIMKELLPLLNLTFLWTSLKQSHHSRYTQETDPSIAQKRTEDIFGELPLALRGVTHIHMILIKRWIQTSMYLNMVIDPVLHNCDLLLFVHVLVSQLNLGRLHISLLSLVNY